MERWFIRWPMKPLWAIAALIAGLLTVACGGGGGSPGANPNSSSVPLALTAPSSLTLGLSASKTYEIFGGTAPYRVQNSNELVAVGGINGNKLTIGAVAVGNASVAVLDAKGVSVPVNIQVVAPPLNITAPTTLTIGLGAGAAQTYFINGGVRPYSVTSSSPPVVFGTLAASGDRFTITGLAVGVGEIVVRDAVGSQAKVAVSIIQPPVTDLFVTAPSTVTVSVGDPQTYTISGGRAPYTATSANTGNVQVSLVGDQLTVRGVKPTERTTIIGAVIQVERWEVDVLVRDSVGGAVTFKVAVVGESASALFTTAPSSVVLANSGPGANQTYTIGGGTPPYSVTSSNAAVVSVAQSGSSITLTGRLTGDAQVVVRDASGAQVVISVTVKQPDTVLQLLPAKLEISERNGNDIQLAIFGGQAPYRVFTTETQLAAVAVAGSVVTVSAPNGDRCFDAAARNDVVLVDDGRRGINTLITVIDALGASATSTLTIVNDPDGCP